MQHIVLKAAFYPFFLKKKKCVCYFKGLGYGVFMSQATIEASKVGLCHLHKTLETKGAKPPRLPRESQTQGVRMDTGKGELPVF